MSAGTGQASGSPSARTPAGAGSAAADAAAAVQEGTWHHRLIELADGMPWIRTLNDQLTAILGPWREKYQGNPVLSGISTRRGRSLAVGVQYTVAPGFQVAAEYQFNDVYQGATNFVAGTTSTGPGGVVGNNAHGQAFVLGNVVNF